MSIIQNETEIVRQTFKFKNKSTHNSWTLNITARNVMIEGHSSPLILGYIQNKEDLTWHMMAWDVLGRVRSLESSNTLEKSIIHAFDLQEPVLEHKSTWAVLSDQSMKRIENVDQLRDLIEGDLPITGGIKLVIRNKEIFSVSRIPKSSLERLVKVKHLSKSRDEENDVDSEDDFFV